MLSPEAERWVEGLTDKERKSISHYAGSDNSFTVNSALREGKTSDLAPRHVDAIADLTSALDSASISRNVVAHRFIRFGAANTLRDLPVGAVFSDAAFVSTTLDPRWAKDKYGMLQMRIKIPKGTKAVLLPVRFNAIGLNEREVLLQRGSRFRVTSSSSVKLEVAVLQ